MSPARTTDHIKITINPKSTIQTTEIAEATEIKRVPADFPVHLMGGINIYSNQLFFL